MSEARAKHTAGPWRIKKNCFDFGDGHGIYSAKELVAKICGGEGQPAKLSDAALIAAAPELLDALEEVNAVLNEHFGITDLEIGGNELHDRIRSILNRAKGA